MRANGDSNKANLRRYTEIKIHNPNTNNLPFGDNIQEPYDSETILFHNINGLKDKTNSFQILMTMYELKVNIFGFNETNQQLNKGKKIWMDRSNPEVVFSQQNNSLGKRDRLTLRLQTGGHNIDDHREMASTCIRPGSRFKRSWSMVFFPNLE
jgi:hypothetical protein